MRTLAYASRTLNSAERNYHVTELECLAIVYAVEQFRPYLYGKKFRVVTDHCSLCRLVNLKNPNGRLARWSLKLMPYEFEIVHTKGTQHQHVDSLSRNPVNKALDEETDFSDRMLLSQQVMGKSIDPVIGINELVEMQQKDSKLKLIINNVKEMNEGVNCDMKNIEDFKLCNDVLYKANWDPEGRLWRICVPKGLREKVSEKLSSL